MNSPVISRFDQLVSDSRPLPLRDWLFILAIACGFGYLIYTFLLVSPPPSQAFFLYNSPRLSATTGTKSGGDLKVIMLGDSRLRYGTFDDDEMSALLSGKTNRRVKVVRLANNWAVFNDFSLLTPQILDLKPNLVVIQEELLTKERSEFATKILARKYWMWRWFGSGPWNPGNMNQEDLQHEMRGSVLLVNETVEERKERAFKWFNFEGNSISHEELSKFLEQATNQGIPVVFVSIPITNRAREGLPSPPQNPAYDVLGPTEPVLDSHYCDVVHMNPEGRKLYSSWLSDVLSSHLLKQNSNVQ